MRTLAVGYCSGSSCECRDNQGVVLDVDASVCADFVAHGRFNPYLRPVEVVKSSPAGGNSEPMPVSAGPSK